MLPLWRGLPSVSRSLTCRTSPVKRLFAHAASPLNEPLSDFQTGNVESNLPTQSVQVSSLANGLKVVSLETYSPKSRVGLFIDAASRHETPETLGITHMLRNAAFLGNEERSGFIIARELEHSGASLEATCDRERLIYSSDCLRDNVEFVVKNLASVVNKPAFYPWELEGPMKHLKLDLAMKDSQIQINVVEELHRVAFRKTLGNSLYCLPHRTGAFSPDLTIKYFQLKSYTEANYVGQRMALVGVGEVINFRPGPLVHAVIATEGPRYNRLIYSNKLLGVTPYIKWGSNVATNRVLRAASNSTAEACAASAFSASYSDSGLFGCYVVAEAASAPKVMKSVVDQFAKASKGDISDEDVTRAKNQMKAHLLMNSESQDTIFEDIGSQILTKGTYTSPGEVAAVVDSITKNDVLTVAKRVFSGKPTLSAAGDVSLMPGLDELF
ncbi:Cytochrome b-c1 complex subunit 2 [Acropora cervicornis]|uniref:Cytochrome b-c1 complex subunit 2 n=1 Tax=Acropora cervicornis TaxID=6130 RepID=A0AAD9V0T2_ACRCE|nr:Cytochrome b-c1 complex subunit 2 [Acropora cervicornis]